MAFDEKGIKRVVSAGSVGTGASSVRSLYLYVTEDDAATVEAAGYFNDFIAQLVIGDQINASLDVDGTPVRKDYIVSGNDGTNVSLTAAAS